MVNTMLIIMSANIIIVMFEVNIKNNGTTNKIVPFAF